MKSIKFANILACEYIAQGVRGKHTLVNIFTGNILVKEIPAMFPLALYLEFLPESDDPVELTIDVIINEEVVIQGEAELPPASAGETALIVLPQFPCQFQQEGELKVVASGPLHRRTILLRKTVTAGPIPD